MKNIRTLLSALGFLLLVATALHAQVPQIINYQGRVAVGTTNFNSPPDGLFKFALVDAGAPAAQATATPISTFNGTAFILVTVNVTNPGLGYLTPPPVSITGGAGTPATAVAIVSAGRVVSIQVTSPGSYTIPPTGVTIGPPTAGTYTSSFWSNNGSSILGSEPTAAISLPVTKGLYSVLLGDATLPNMQVVPGTVFANSDVRLRVWFNNGTNGFQLLAPDQRIAAVGYAMIAGNVQDGAITAAKIATGAITSTKIASGAVGSTQLATGAVGPTQIASAAIGATQLANDSIQAGKILNGSLLGEDFAANTITGTQIGDFLELGSTSTDGTLYLWDSFFNRQSIRLEGGSSSISIYGTDGLVGMVLGNESWGALDLHDNAAANNRTAQLSAHELTSPGNFPFPGGALRLAYAAQEEVYLKASSLGGILQLSRSDGQPGISLLSEENAGEGGTLLLYDNAGIDIFKVSQDEVEGGGELRLSGANGGLKVLIEAQKTANQGGAITLYRFGGTETVSISADDSSEPGGKLRLRRATGATTIFMEASETATDGARVSLFNAAGTETLTLDAEHGDGGPSRVTTGTLQITGGSDLSEQFNIHSATGQPAPAPGMIVCIDPARPGELRTSSGAYDRTVAGIISGAGGIRPGMLMGQQNSLADGAHSVALSGRVYVKANASAGAIVPGDLLTTSEVPGEAMKAADRERAQGSILGKAMTPLDETTGLVLVIVTLQ